MRECRSLLLLLTTLVPVFAVGACGKLKPADTSDADIGDGAAGAGGGAGSFMVTGNAGTNGRVRVNVSGTAAPHPLNKVLVAMDQDFSMLKVSIVDPTAVLVDPAALPLGAMPLGTSAANCDATTACKWALAGVDITNQNLGLVGSLEDERTGDARVWVKTGTGMATKADLDLVRAAPAPITDRRAFAVSRKLEAALGAFAGKALGKTFVPGDLEARGFLIGHIVGKLSEGPVPAGVAGAKISATGNFDILYPNADFTVAGTTTAASGIFIMVPKAVEPVVTTWEVLPPANETRGWAMNLVAGSNPNSAFVVILPAKE